MHALPIIAIVLSSVALLRTRRRSLACGRRGPGCHGYHGHRGPFRGRGLFRGRGPRHLMHWLSEELDLSPAQEKAVREELSSLREEFGDVREEGRRSRTDLADVLRGESFQAAGLDAMFARHDEKLSSLRQRFAASLARIHELLDPSQRERLADLSSKSRRSWGPYR